MVIDSSGMNRAAQFALLTHSQLTDPSCPDGQLGIGGFQHDAIVVPDGQDRQSDYLSTQGHPFAPPPVHVRVE